MLSYTKVGKKSIISIRLAEEDLAKIAVAAEESHRTVADYVRDTLRQYGIISNKYYDLNANEKRMLSKIQTDKKKRGIDKCDS